ncbi:MAG: CoA synthetase [Alphaproteobacteria bacterium]|nr:CoA synthetase [Alphaproteobacteria bacterium]
MTGPASLIALDALAERIPDGALLAVPKDESGVAMAASRALVRRAVKELHLLCVPTSGMQADMLIGAGCVGTVECGAVSLDEFGYAPCFRRAAETGAIRVLDSTCPAIYAALQASEKGQPFAPLRGVIGSDVQRHRADWKVIQNPMAEGEDPVLILPAIRPDIALFHAPLADVHGNVWVGNRRELVIMAHAAAATLATVEEIADINLAADERYAAGTISALYVDALAEAEGGARPLGLHGRYGRDDGALRAYAEAARSEDGFQSWLDRHVLSGREAA